MLFLFELKSGLDFRAFFRRFGIDENVISFRLVFSMSNDNWDFSFTKGLSNLRFLSINGDEIRIAKISEKMSDIGNSASTCSKDNDMHRIWGMRM